MNRRSSSAKSNFSPGDPAFDKLVCQVGDLIREKECLNKKICDLEKRVSDSDSKAACTTIEKCTTHICWMTDKQCGWTTVDDGSEQDCCQGQGNKEKSSLYVVENEQDCSGRCEHGAEILLLYTPPDKKGDPCEKKEIDECDPCAREESKVDESMCEEPEEDKDQCSEEMGTCDCMKLMKESVEWKENVTSLLELLVLNAYGDKCPKTLVNRLLNPCTRDQAIKELLATIGLNNNCALDTEAEKTLSELSCSNSQSCQRSNVYKFKQQEDDNYKKPAAASCSLGSKDCSSGKPRTPSDRSSQNTSRQIESRFRKTTTSHPREELNNQKGAMNNPKHPYDEYPPPLFEGRLSSPQLTKSSASSRKSFGSNGSSQQQSCGKVDIVCPPGSRPVIHIPKCNGEQMSCDGPKSHNSPASMDCCSPKKSCQRYK